MPKISHLVSGVSIIVEEEEGRDKIVFSYQKYESHIGSNRFGEV